MATDLKQENSESFGNDIDIYNIIKDVLKYKWIILVLAVSAVLLSYVQASKSYSPTYTVEATYVVTAKGMGNDVFSNLSTAQDTANRFSQIINSTTLKNKVGEELGTGYVPGTITAEIVPETNLMALKVVSGTPSMAFKILRSVMNNYTILSDYLVGNAIIEVLVPPVIPESADNPFQPMKVMTYAFILTVIGLAAVCGVVSYMKDTVRRASDVEKKLDTKLLGTINHEDKRRSILTKLRRRKTSLLITNQAISFRYVELFQKTTKKVQDRMDRAGAQTLLVTSYMENEGKSTVAANLALTMAQNGKKVLLLDGDLRKPAQYKIFEQFYSPMTEFIDILQGKGTASKMIGRLDKHEIYTIFNTKGYQNSIELISNRTMQYILEYLKTKFDYIVLDVPPMAMVADTEEIAGIVDASLVVVREHCAPTRDINDMIDVLNGAKSTFIGCIFNDAHRAMGSGGYGYGYGGGRYGYGGYGYARNYAKTQK